MPLHADSTKVDGVVGKPSIGLYGAAPGCYPRMASVPAGGYHDGTVRLEAQTNQRIARAVAPREQRNHKRINGLFSLNMSPVFRGPGTPSGSGLKYYQAVYDPAAQAYLHLGYHPERKGWAQTPQQIMQARRVQDNRMRTARIEAAAPAQVAWKVPYVVGQRNVQPIGPYQSLKQKSILYRLSDMFNTMGGG